MRKTGITTLMFYMILFSAYPAHAYLDPGAGSLILQVILGGIAGIAILGKLFWNRLKEFFQFGKQKRTGDKKTEL